MKSMRAIMAAVMTALVVMAIAHPSTQIEFGKLAKPPKDSPLAKASCAACHVGIGKPALNPYGKDLAAAMKALKTKSLTAAVLKKTAKLDSDKDKASNEKEIKAGTLPGDPKSKPAK